MMSTSEQRLTVPDNLTSPEAKLVYLSIEALDTPTASDLQELLGLSKLTLLPVLHALTADDLVRRTEEGYVAR